MIQKKIPLWPLSRIRSKFNESNAHISEHWLVKQHRLFNLYFILYQGIAVWFTMTFHHFCLERKTDSNNDKPLDRQECCHEQALHCPAWPQAGQHQQVILFIDKRSHPCYGKNDFFLPEFQSSIFSLIRSPMSWALWHYHVSQQRDNGRGELNE